MVLKIYETIHTKISFNTREGVRWFFVYCFGVWYIKRSFNTRVGVRWFEKVGKEQDHDDEFQYPCGCEVVREVYCNSLHRKRFNTRVGVRWFLYSLIRNVSEIDVFQYPCGCEVVLNCLYMLRIVIKFQYPCGCEVVQFLMMAKLYLNSISFNTRVGVWWFCTKHILKSVQTVVSIPVWV